MIPSPRRRARVPWLLAVALLAASCAGGGADEGRAWTLPFAVDDANGCATIATPFSVANPWDAAHEGLDFACERGTTILAVAEGEVAAIDPVSIRGERRLRLTLVVEGEGLRVEYANLSQVIVAPADRVRRGEAIGESALGLHLAVWSLAEEKYIDPGDVLPLSELQAAP